MFFFLFDVSWHRSPTAVFFLSCVRPCNSPVDGAIVLTTRRGRARRFVAFSGITATGTVDVRLDVTERRH